jgi:outer membrane lipoprotein SlyB
MTYLKYGVASAAAVALLLSLAPASAQQPARVRGTIEKVDGNTLTVKSREGATVTVVLKDNALIAGVEKAALADVKQNSFVGITAMPQPDGTQKAIEVHIFPEARRGAGEGHRPWDLVPNSTMTNANVEQLVTAVDGPMLTMKYKDGEKKISVPNDATIVQFVAGDKSDLKPGAKIFIAAGTKLANGDIETAGINVGKNGLTPPM